jgi:hypothetical protein
MTAAVEDVTIISTLGWIENRTVAIEYRFGELRAERYAEIAAEFVRLKRCHSCGRD